MKLFALGTPLRKVLAAGLLCGSSSITTTIILGAAVAAVAADPRSPHGGTWTKLAPIANYPRQEQSTVTLSPTTIAIIGGIIPFSAGDNTTGILQFYDIPTNCWRSGAPLPRTVNHANAAVVDGKIYVLGALVDSPDGAWRAIPNAWVYNPRSNTWRELPPMPTAEARGSCAVGVYGKTIWLAGGMTVLAPWDGGEQGTVDTVTAFDTATERWVATVPAAAQHLPGPRDHVGGAVVGDGFYVLGGRDHGQFNWHDTVFKLDLRRVARGWETKAGKMPTPRGGLAAAAIGNKVYTFGGEGNPAPGSNGVFNQTEAYDTVRDSWEKLAPMALPRHGTFASAAGGRVYIPGGGLVIGGAPTNYSDVFRP
ncbi:hypothetical protein B0T24DRAFT_359018 [Lasiosphaeria ovina]|uniref:Galactose oxidase n=1 Tax=Lasiosphaeria ovina TaxID=92902 RepID=A0AAE0K4A1_9PEZI|nr:hypothetical protein B0T24DRAFT_359018 [Lasiosphaeria ovina]